MKKVKISKKAKEQQKLVAKVVSNVLNTDMDIIFAKTNAKESVIPRHAICYNARKHIKEITLVEIGVFLGDKDHSTVINGIKKWGDLIETSNRFQKYQEKISNKIILDIASFSGYTDNINVKNTLAQLEWGKQNNLPFIVEACQELLFETNDRKVIKNSIIEVAGEKIHTHSDLISHKRLNGYNKNILEKCIFELLLEFKIVNIKGIYESFNGHTHKKKKPNLKEVVKY